jgi:NTP pyrophosphatase (non-canonical NTP hydrolase)
MTNEEFLKKEAAYLKEESTKSIATWSKEIHEEAVKHGWWEEENRSNAEQFMNMTAEISEAWEEWRCNKPMDYVYWVGDKPEGVPIELADCVIRIMDTCYHYGIDLEKMMEIKHTYNKTRSYRHGGKKA